MSNTDQRCIKCNKDLHNKASRALPALQLSKPSADIFIYTYEIICCLKLFVTFISFEVK